MISESRDFQVLASHLNFTTAARELNESQSSLSRHIDSLEHELGFRLLERSPVCLTPAGGHYLEGISEVLLRIDSLVGECRAIADDSRHSLGISMIQATDHCTYLVYGVLSTMGEQRNDFSYSFDDNRKLTIAQAVQEGVADVGIAYSPAPEDMAHVVTRKIFDEPFTVWMNENNPLLQQESIRFSDLSSCTVLLSANRKFQTWVEGMRSACQRYGANPDFKMRSLDSIVDFLISLRGNEVVFASSSADEEFARHFQHLRSPKIQSDAPLTYPVYLLFRDDNGNPALQEFIDLFCERATGR